ncbi:MAG: hypothetical protein ACYDGN_15395 [Acidimicrobiales bacterium]
MGTSKWPHAGTFSWPWTEISRYGAGLQLVPAGRTAQVVLEGGVPVVTGDTRIDDEIVFGLLDAGRR